MTCGHVDGFLRILRFPQTDHHDKTEKLLKVALNIITLPPAPPPPPNQLVRTTLLPQTNFRYDFVYYFLPDMCDSDNIMTIRHFLIVTDYLYILTFFSKSFIKFYLIRTFFFQLLSLGQNGQLICHANIIIMNYVIYCF